MFLEWCDNYQAQIVVLAAQVIWSEDVEAALSGKGDLKSVLNQVETTLNVLADCVLQKQPSLRRKKLEALVSFKFNFKNLYPDLYNFKLLIFLELVIIKCLNNKCLIVLII